MTGLLSLKSSEFGDWFLRDSRGVPRPWDFLSGGSFMLSPNQFLGEALSSQMEDSLRKNGCASIVARVQTQS